ncbi:MAG: hypothetical protein ACW7DW_01270 [Paraglaciecola chathamensis]|uniref:Uncharacterized protein n=1 Tax=Paraglaciecola agarilytica NO2 TaxID=1125747 RepID=A0ABQ0IEB9_9ALTE|nr:hypothetical protein [Paraglaciecola agarilytica]GAC07730.1 hypothetical protein GAGA_4907 [Paraglaciecola agarilytica NO2]
MKTLLSLTTVITLAAGGFLLNAQADESVSTSSSAVIMSTIPLELKQLGAKLEGSQYDLTDRNTKLRVQRALHYYAVAQKHADSGWGKMAADQAGRGLSLLELKGMKYRVSTEVQM